MAAKLQSQEFTSTGTFVVPTGVTSVLVTLIAGGAGGGNPTPSNFTAGSGGGAGEYCTQKPVKVTSGASITVTIGNGGSAQTSGQASSFGSLISCQGGYPGSSVQSGIAPAFVSNGGGVGGGQVGDAAGFPPNGIPAMMGKFESRSFYGGSSGGGVPRNKLDILPGAACGPWAGGGMGAPDQNSNGSGGAGGGSSILGQGGQGGDCAAVLGHTDGRNAPASSFGAGGGGVGSVAGTGNTGGSGASGYCLVQWVS